jgi:hypothetical protein
MRVQWGTPSLTLPSSYTRIQDKVESIVNSTDTLYFIYDGADCIDVVSTVNACSKYVNDGTLAEPIIYCANLNDQTSERVF